jgi:diphosphomevalonate decarboxylase
VFTALQSSKNIDQTRVGFSAPSNIALVKYWGKYPIQLPANPSISFTLNECKSETYLEIKKSQSPLKDFSVEVLVDDHINESFKPKILSFFKRIEPYFTFLRDYHFKVETRNTFPHSSGIASSASGFAALSSCLVNLEHQLSEKDSFNKAKASFISRLGSGSAARSISGPMMVWGKHEHVTGSNDETAVVFKDIHDVFKDYQDIILLVDKGQKQVSSTVGHGLMNNHPFAQSRFKQAHNHLSEILPVLKNGDLEQFIKITESEALSLHAMMMSSQPYFILMKPNTLSIIENIWQFRADTGIPISFTLDAGANVHVLFPKAHVTKVLELINAKLVRYCQNEQYICDSIGKGIKPLS